MAHNQLTQTNGVILMNDFKIGDKVQRKAAFIKEFQIVQEIVTVTGIDRPGNFLETTSGLRQAETMEVIERDGFKIGDIVVRNQKFRDECPRISLLPNKSGEWNQGVATVVGFNSYELIVKFSVEGGSAKGIATSYYVEKANNIGAFANAPDDVRRPSEQQPGDGFAVFSLDVDAQVKKLQESIVLDLAKLSPKIGSVHIKPGSIAAAFLSNHEKPKLDHSKSVGNLYYQMCKAVEEHNQAAEDNGTPQFELVIKR